MSATWDASEANRDVSRARASSSSSRGGRPDRGCRAADLVGGFRRRGVHDRLATGRRRLLGSEGELEGQQRNATRARRLGLCVHQGERDRGLPERASVAGINVSGELDVTAGTLTLASPADDSYVQAMTLSGGTLSGAGKLHVPGELAWTGGAMAGTGTTEIDSSGDLTQTSTGPTTLADGRTLDVLGALSIDPAGGLAETGVPASLVHIESGATMVREDGTGATTIAVPLRNEGSVDAGNGTAAGDGLYLGAASTSAQTGIFTGSSTAPVAFTGGTWTMASPASLSGKIAIQGGALNMASGSTSTHRQTCPWTAARSGAPEASARRRERRSTGRAARWAAPERPRSPPARRSTSTAPRRSRSRARSPTQDRLW